MKFLIVVLALAAVAAAKQQSLIAIVRQAADVNPDGYKYDYQTENKISASEEGVLKAANNEEGRAIAARGQFAYVADDGTPIDLTYVADENGFQPQGAHLPVGPAIPEAILRAIEYNKAHPEQNKSR